MRKLFFIDDTLANKISYWHLVGFLITLPFDFFYSEFILISFAAHTLIHCKGSYLKTVFSKEVCILTSIYILGAVCIVYSPDKPEGINIAGKQLAILIMPVIFALTSLDLEKYQLHLCKFFAFTCTVTIIYLYADALRVILYFHLPLSSLFSLIFMNHNFCLPIDIHATYMSLYVAFAIIIFAYCLSFEKKAGIKYFYIACICILSIGLLQLSSRAVFIALLLVINIAFPLLLFKGKKRVRFSVISLSLSLALFFVISNIDAFKVRYFNELKKDLVNKAELVEINEPRMARWELIMGLVKRSPVIGYGTGAEKQMLKEKYFENRLYSSYINEFNTHSEYLSLLLKMGIIGLALFLYTLFTGFASAWKKRDLLFFGFLILISIVGVSENVLDLNKGIFFYSFFFSLFLLRDKIKNRLNSGILTAESGNRT